MSTYTIGDASARSGFSASALRYYDRIGLVGPSTRTDAGYRLYDDRALDRLAFIGRARQLGCSLQEIIDLAGIWGGERCGPVQRRFHDLVTTKIRDAQARIVEVTEFVTQLRIAAEQLSAEPADGPCGPECACVADRRPGADSTSGPSMVTLGRSPAPTPDEVPIACTLRPGAQFDRLAEWSDALATATHRVAVEGGVRVEFGSDVDVGELGRLVGAEQRCCAFLSFTLSVGSVGTVLEIRAPEVAAGMVADLFGAP